MARSDTVKGFAAAIVDFILEATEDAAIDAQDEIALNQDLDGEDPEEFSIPKETLGLLSMDILEDVISTLIRRKHEALNDVITLSVNSDLLQWDALRLRYPRQRYLL